MSENILRNDRGAVLVTSLLILTLLMIVGISAINTTTFELQIAGNDRVARKDFYNQEVSCINGEVHWEDWLPVLLAGGDDAFFPPFPATTDVNSNGIDDRSEFVDSTGVVVGAYKVRKVVKVATVVGGWDDPTAFGTTADHPANKVPLLDHTDKPPVSSGFDQDYVIARYAITSYSNINNRNAIIQAGVYKVFQESNQ
ncbi:MAG: pilus assembly PilX N-terminal domain-containing protein [Methylococcales bacterium]